jgi:hypothetical protein
MINTDTDLIQCSYLSIQDTELDSVIDKQFPSKLIGTIFSNLTANDISSTNAVSTFWKDISVEVAKRDVAKNLNSFIHLLLDNLDEKNAEIKTKIRNLLSETKISGDSVVDLLQIKETLLRAKGTLAGLINELPIEDQRFLKKLLEFEKKPLHFHNTFALVPDLDTFDLCGRGLMLNNAAPFISWGALKRTIEIEHGIVWGIDKPRFDDIPDDIDLYNRDLNILDVRRVEAMQNIAAGLINFDGLDRAIEIAHEIERDIEPNGFDDISDDTDLDQVY